MIKDSKNYEVGFLVREESDREDVVKTISGQKSTIIDEGKISKIRLAYPVGKESFAYFGHIIFSVGSDVIGKIEKELKINPKILRYLIITPPAIKSEISQTRPRRQAGEYKIAKKVEKVEVKKAEQKTSLSNEELEKKLEEILK